LLLSDSFYIFSVSALGADTYSLTPSNNTAIDITASQNAAQVAAISAGDATTTQRTYSVAIQSLNGGLLNTTAKNKSGASGTYLKTYKIGFTMSSGSSLSPSTPLLDLASIGTTKQICFQQGNHLHRLLLP